MLGEQDELYTFSGGIVRVNKPNYLTLFDQLEGAVVTRRKHPDSLDGFMAADIADNTGVVDSVVLAEVLFLEMHDFWVGPWSEAVQGVVAVSIAADAVESGVNSLEVSDLEGNQHVERAAIVGEVALPLLGLHLDLESAFHTSQTPLARDDSLIKLTGVVDGVGTLVGLVELDLVASKLTVNGEFTVSVLATTVDLAAAAQLHVLEVNIVLGTELLVPAGPFDLVSDTSFVIFVTVMHFVY